MDRHCHHLFQFDDSYDSSFHLRTVSIRTIRLSILQTVSICTICPTNIYYIIYVFMVHPKNYYAAPQKLLC